jgi:hypothetical protein
MEACRHVLYVVVERIYDPDVVGELFRLRAHLHPAGASRTATWSNNIVRDEPIRPPDVFHQIPAR